MRISFRTPLLALCAAWTAAMWSTPASAHPDLGEHHGFLDGLAHPFLGADHLMAMAATGMIAAKYGAPLSWRLPLSFVLLMAIGSLAGLAHPSSIIEAAVALSLVCLGGWLVVGQRIPQAAGIGLSGAFGFLHGWAHGAEQVAHFSTLWFIAGVLLSTAPLHLAGIRIARNLNRLSSAARRFGWLAAASVVTLTGVAAFANATDASVGKLDAGTALRRTNDLPNDCVRSDAKPPAASQLKTTSTHVVPEREAIPPERSSTDERPSLS